MGGAVPGPGPLGTFVGTTLAENRPNNLKKQISTNRLETSKINETYAFVSGFLRITAVKTSNRQNHSRQNVKTSNYSRQNVKTSNRQTEKQ